MSGDSSTVQQPIQAIRASVAEVFETYRTGVVTDGIYRATRFVPFPSQNERDLVELFPASLADEEYDRIVQSLAFYLRLKVFSGIDKPLLKDFTAALPTIMAAYRQDISDRIERDPALSQHLPPAYLEAYRNIR